MRLTARRAAAVFGALPFVLAACGGDDGTSSQTTVVIDTTDFATIPPVESTVAPETTLAPVGEQSYTVQSGDVLVNIAKRFGTTAEEIASYNGWADGTAHLIYAGLVIKIPPTATGTTVAGAGATTTTGVTTTTVDTAAEATYTVEDGDTLSGIATKFGVTVDQLVAVNGWTDGSAHLIYAGMVIKIPAKTG
jgi:LysM repeat protein